jgi:hypothetical protein
LLLPLELKVFWKSGCKEGAQQQMIPTLISMTLMKTTIPMYLESLHSLVKTSSNEYVDTYHGKSGFGIPIATEMTRAIVAIIATVPMENRIAKRTNQGYISVVYNKEYYEDTLLAWIYL